MTTTVIKSIGSAAGRDFATIADWLSYIASLSDITSATGNDTIQIGECYNDSVFSEPTLVAPQFLTVSSTNYVLLRAASGQSFRDNANKLTNALAYNEANGVAIRVTNAGAGVMNCGQGLLLSGLQIKSTGAHSGSFCILNTNDTGFPHIDNCIVDLGTSTTSATAGVATNASTPPSSGGSRNSVYVTNKASRILFGAQSVSATFIVEFNTLVNTVGASSVAFGANTTAGNPTIFRNNVAIGYSATSLFSSVAVVPAATNNACDGGLGTTSIGSGNLSNITAANTVVSVTNDFRTKSGSVTIGAGTTGSVTTDIYGQTRASPPGIGAHEFLSSGTTFFKTCAAATTAGAFSVRAPKPLRSASSALSAAAFRQTGVLRFSTTPSIAVLARSVRRSSAAATSSLGTVKKQTGVTRTAATPALASFLRGAAAYTRLLTAASPALSSIARALARARTFSASTTLAALTFKRLAATRAATTALLSVTTRAFTATRTATTLVLATIARGSSSFARTLSAASAALAALTTRQTLARTLTAASPPLSTTVRAVGASRPAATPILAASSRATARTLSAFTTLLATLGRVPTLFRALVAATAALAALATLRVALRTLSAATPVLAATIRFISAARAAPTAGLATVAKSVNRPMTAASAPLGIVVTSKALLRTLAASTPVLASLAAIRVALRTLSAATAAFGSAFKQVGAARLASSPALAATSRFTRRTLAAVSTALGAAPHSLFRTLAASTPVLATLAVLRVALRTLTGATAPLGASFRQISASRAAVTPVATSLTRASSFTRSATTTAVGSLARTLTRALTASASAQAAISRGAASATRTLSASLSAGGVLFRTVFATRTGVTPVVGSYGRIQSLRRALSATTPVGGAAPKLVSTTKVAASSALGLLAAVKQGGAQVFRTLATAVAASATINRSLLTARSATTAVTPAISRFTARVLVATTAVQPSRVVAMPRRLSAATAALGTVIATRVTLKAISAATTVVGVCLRTYQLVRTGIVATAPSIRRNLFVTRAVVASVAPVVSKATPKRLIASSPAFGVLFGSRAQVKTVQAAVTSLGVFSRTKSTTLQAVLMATASMSKFLSVIRRAASLVRALMTRLRAVAPQPIVCAHFTLATRGAELVFSSRGAMWTFNGCECV